MSATATPPPPSSGPILLSSPGRKEGVFYESQTLDRDRFVCVQAGLLDCPHIPKSKIDDLTATYAEKNPQFLRSVLHGEFMDAEEEQVFDREGLVHIQRLIVQGPRPTDARIDPIEGGQGSKVRQVQLVVCRPDDPGRYFRFWEPRIEGCRYLIVADSAKGRKEHVTIYEQGWDIWCPHLLAELTTFVKKPDGREEAEGSLKDDDVMAWLIGRRCLESGTIYREQVREQQRPQQSYQRYCAAT